MALRAKTARIRAARRVTAALLVLSCLLAPFGAPPVAQAGKRPWDLPEDERELARRYKAPEYWFERYLSAESILAKQGREPNPADLDKAIALLQLAIAKRASSSAKEIHPTERREFAYVPYFLLALAYYGKRDIHAATLCLREAEAQGAVQRSVQAQSYQKLKGELTRLAELERLQGTARILQAWQQTGLGGCVSEPSRRAAAETLRDAKTLTDEKKSNDEIRERLIRGVTEVIRAESSRMQARLDELRSAAWSRALEGNPLTVPSGVCDLGSLRVDPAQVEQVAQKLVACCDATAEGLRLAAQRACDTLGQVRGRVVAQLDVERRLGSGQAGQPPPPAVPDPCSRMTWNDLDLAGAWAAIDAIAFQDNLQRFDGALAAVTGRLAEKQEGLRRELASAREGIFTADRACAMELRLGETNTKLGALESSIERALGGQDPSATAELGDVAQQIEQARGTLVSRAVEGAASLGAMREQFEGIDASSFTALPAATDAFRQSPSQSSLDRLCQAVSGIRGAINEWGQKNVPTFERQLRSYRWFLEVAGRWQQPGSTDKRLGCIEPSLAALPGAYSAANSGAWVSQASTGISQARECLANYRERWDGWAAAIRRDVDEMARAAERLGQGSSVPKIGEMRESLGATRASLDRLQELLALPDSFTNEALRGALDALAVTVPPERWTRLGELSGVEAPEGRAMVRDEALRAQLASAAEALRAWRPLVDKLGPYLALDRAIEDYNRGDLDAAILALRRGAAQEQAQGKAAAMMHATLSFLLFTKSQLLGQTKAGERVHELLLEDARLQAVAAVRASPEFRLPAFLARGARFEDFFESCRSM